MTPELRLSLNVLGRADKSNLRYLNLINAGTVNMGMKAYPIPFFSFPSRQLLCFWAFIPLSQPDFISTTWRGARSPPDIGGNAGVSSPLSVNVSSLFTHFWTVPLPSPLFIWEGNLCHWPESERRKSWLRLLENSI